MSTDARSKQLYTVEVTGPVLPHTLYGLSDLFAHTHNKYTASISVHEPTAAFNVTKKISPDDTMEDQSDKDNTIEASENIDCDKLSLTPKEAKYFCRASDLDKKGIKELRYAEDLYTWTV